MDSHRLPPLHYADEGSANSSAHLPVSRTVGIETIPTTLSETAPIAAAASQTQQQQHRQQAQEEHQLSRSIVQFSQPANSSLPLSGGSPAMSPSTLAAGLHSPASFRTDASGSTLVGGATTGYIAPHASDSDTAARATMSPPFLHQDSRRRSILVNNNALQAGATAAARPASSLYQKHSATDSLVRDRLGNVYHPSVAFADNDDDGQSTDYGKSEMLLSKEDTSMSAQSRNQLHPTLSYGDGTANYDGPASQQVGLGASAGNQSEFKRKRSLVRPERAPMDPSHPLFNYRQHAAIYEAEAAGRVGQSSTGAGGYTQTLGMPYGGGAGGVASAGLAPGMDGRPGLRRGKSILAREEGSAPVESGLNFLKRGATLVRNRKSKDVHAGGHLTAEDLLGRGPGGATGVAAADKRASIRKQAAKGSKDKGPPLGAWMIYCYAITACLPGPILRLLGYRSVERRRAFREKIGLLSIILLLMTAVGFLTFGFTDAVCANSALNFQAGTVQAGSMVFHGYDYSMDSFQHPGVAGVAANSNPLYSDWAAGGRDGSFMFQNTNGNCKGIITRAQGSRIPQAANGNLGWYFPCNLFGPYDTATANKTGYDTGTLCHRQTTARTWFDQTRTRNVSGMIWQGPVFYTWANITNSTRNYGVYNGAVLDFNLLRWLDRRYVSYPAAFDSLAAGNTSYEGRDSTMQLLIAGNRTVAECLNESIRVGFVDSQSMGCIVADIVLYVSLVFILAVVGIKFGMAVVFSWFFGRRMGGFRKETEKERQKRMEEVEAWTKDIYRPAPAKYRPNVKNNRKSFLPTASRFTANPARPYSMFDTGKRQSTYGAFGQNLSIKPPKGSPPDSPLRNSRSNTSLPLSTIAHSRASSYDMVDAMGKPCPFQIEANVVPQPAGDFQPYGFPLAHTLLLVTAYSESVEGLRTTLDSLATTDYPNSHKLILVIADGMVKGSGNSMATPDIVLAMMKELVIPQEDVEPTSYVAVADGHKRHNQAKVYAGFYDYDNETVEQSKQQRVAMILIAKCGNPLEAHDAKPGNRGKRDSQIVLMAFLQKVMFDERMTNFEYEFFNAIWRVSGISPDHYEQVLMVDADTKVFPDSVTRMVATMQQDVDIMGLCGETKIANKSETWVTMIQVFEYYISHHQTKAFESMWGGVTCLPGCFSMYRIKAPKGDEGYWVPILANPDIVEHYSENVVDTLHKKNLLLLGEDRYLTTLMLKTFPKRKMMFCPQAYCKTVVPDTFRVLLSQRRRWINSTIHNLFELLLVRDLCGTFCFSMQFVVFMELVGTLVLPAAIAFTLYILVLTCTPREPKPIIPLVLLACILGLPGILIVVTSRRFAFLGWMLIYLLSLPIWNAVLPAYAYLHMDDFSWGSTRKVEGESKTAGHGDKEGEFDSGSITMRRWADWERERRWKSGMSRDSTYEYVSARPYSHAPHLSAATRASMISNTDTYTSGLQDPFYPRGGSPNSAMPILQHGRRVDSVQVLELPAPLSAAPQTQPYQHIPSTTEIYDVSDPTLQSYETSPYQSGSSENVHQASRLDEDYGPRYHGSFDGDGSERDAMLAQQSPRVYDASAVSSPQASEMTHSQRARTPSPNPVITLRSPKPHLQGSRGVSLVDSGPVAAPGGAMRIIQRQHRPSNKSSSRPSLDVPPSASASPSIDSTSAMSPRGAHNPTQASSRSPFA